MSVKEDLQTVRESLGDDALAGLEQHPDPGRLLACLEGHLEGEDAERVRDHLALCSDCADLALTLAAEEGTRGPLDPTEHEIAAAVAAAAAREDAWRTIRQKPEVRPSEVTSRRTRGMQRWLPALAAALLLATLGFWLRTFQLQRALEQSLAPRPGLQTIDLIPLEDGLRRVEGLARVRAEAGDGDLALYLYLPQDRQGGDTGPYRVEISPEDGRDDRRDTEALWRVDGLQAEDDGLVFLTLDRRSLPAGRYSLRLASSSDSHWVATYKLEVESSGL